MRTVIVIALVCALACGHAASVVDPESNWIWDEDHNIDGKASKLVLFKLFTRNNRDDPEWVRAVDVTGKLPVDLAFFDPARPTKIIVHGWHSKLQNSLSLKDVLLSASDANVVVVDWKKVDSIVYPTSVGHLPSIARQVAAYMKYLLEHEGASADSFHMIGHSLGAHISGLSAADLKKSTGKLVARITGLDPAGPLIKDDPSRRLDETDAAFVDVIHTCGNVLGFPHSLGHVDFFPNGGHCSQAGCTLQDIVGAGKCSHNRAWDLFRETVRQGDSMLARPALVQSRTSVSPCDAVDESGATVPMGAATPTSARGQYCLSTRAEQPYGYGESGAVGVPHQGRRLSSHRAEAMRRAFLTGY